MGMGRVMEKPNQELIEQQHQILKCPRCDSSNTKFCYYNNYSLSQPRHFCKACKRYWTRGGTLRNVPVGGACRKNKRLKRPLTTTTTSSQPPRIDVVTAPTSTTSSNHINNNINPLFYDITYNNLPLLPRYEQLLQPQPHHMIMNTTNSSVGVGLDFTSAGIMYGHGHDHENAFSGASNTTSFERFGSALEDHHHHLQIGAANKSGELLEGQQNSMGMGWPNNNYNYQMELEHVPNLSDDPSSLYTWNDQTNNIPPNSLTSLI